ncbi:MAG: TonB family protein [Terriglobia bacterium]
MAHAVEVRRVTDRLYSSLLRKRSPVALLAVALLAGTTSARAALTPSCQEGPDEQVFQLNRREAKKLLLSEIKPSYPPLARVNYIRGRVQLLVTVDCRGRVQRIHVIRGHPFLAIAALNAIRRWVYRPFLTKAGPAGFQTLVDINFSLVSPDTDGLPRFPPEPEKFLARSVVPPKLLSDANLVEAKETLRVRLLVSRKGRVVDATPLAGTQIQSEAARKEVARWRFRPARWGTLNVPWYLEVNVPVPAAANKGT